MLVGSKGHTFLETIYCCVSLFATVGMFATILSKIAMVLEDMEKTECFFEQLDMEMQEKNYKREKEVI